MKAIYRVGNIGLVMFALLLCGCMRAEHPIRLVQLCVNNADGIALLKKELRIAAEERELVFKDSSGAVKRDLEVVGYSERRHTTDDQIVKFSAIRPDGLGFTALNVGLPPYQIALAFSRGSDRTEAIRVAEEVVMRLRRHWKVEDAPPGSGVMPDESCR